MSKAKYSGSAAQMATNPRASTRRFHDGHQSWADFAPEFLFENRVPRTELHGRRVLQRRRRRVSRGRGKITGFKGGSVKGAPEFLNACLKFIDKGSS